MVWGLGGGFGVIGGGYVGQWIYNRYPPRMPLAAGLITAASVFPMWYVAASPAARTAVVVLSYPPSALSRVRDMRLGATGLFVLARMQHCSGKFWPMSEPAGTWCSLEVRLACMSTCRWVVNAKLDSSFGIAAAMACVFVGGLTSSVAGPNIKCAALTAAAQHARLQFRPAAVMA